MQEDVMQWLEEIRTLKQQVSELQTERDEAIARESKWRKLYSTEAQQRRTEARLVQEEINELKAQLYQLKMQGIRPAEGTEDASAAVEKEIAGLETIEELRGKLGVVIRERDRALEALQEEQENHAQTRKSLTAVIADTIDSISKQNNSINSDQLPVSNDQQPTTNNQ